MTPGDHPTVELALSELRRSVDVGLTEIRGQLALLLQRSEQAERRADQQDKEIEWLRQGPWRGGHPYSPFRKATTR